MQGVPSLPPNLVQEQALAMQRSSVAGRGHGTGDIEPEPRGVEVVGRNVPGATREATQGQELGSAREASLVALELPPVIDLSEDEVVPDENLPGEVLGFERNRHQLVLRLGVIEQRLGALRAARTNLEADRQNLPTQAIPVTPQSRRPLDTTIDLTGSPDTPALVSSLNTNSPFYSTVPPSSPSLSSIQCPVCLESISGIRRQGKTI